MHVSLRGPAEQALQMNLPCCRIEQVRASDDIGHALFPIVHHDGKLIGKKPVGAQDYKISAIILHILRL